MGSVLQWRSRDGFLSVASGENCEHPFFVLRDKVLPSNPGWTRICYVAHTDLELIILQRPGPIHPELCSELHTEPCLEFILLFLFAKGKDWTEQDLLGPFNLKMFFPLFKMDLIHA